MTNRRELYAEYPSASESALIEDVWADITARQQAQLGAGTNVLRGFNSKQYGATRACLKVRDDLAEELQVGVFQAGVAYDAIVRFGGGSPAIASDDKKTDPCSFSIKLLGVSGDKLLADRYSLGAVDFILLNRDSFFVKDLKEFTEITRAIRDKSLLRFLRFYFNPFHPRVRQLRSLKHNSGQLLEKDLLAMRYWSTTPYRFGNRAVKYKLTPIPPLRGADLELATSGPEHLSENFTRVMKTSAARFDLGVQLQVDPDKMPIEDATVVWDEASSPFRSVATIELEPCDKDYKAFSSMVDGLDFNPWNTLEAHRPIGGMNRARKEIYRRSFDARHEANHRGKDDAAQVRDVRASLGLLSSD